MISPGCRRKYHRAKQGVSQTAGEWYPRRSQLARLLISAPAAQTRATIEWLIITEAMSDGLEGLLRLAFL